MNAIEDFCVLFFYFGQELQMLNFVHSILRLRSEVKYFSLHYLVITNSAFPLACLRNYSVPFSPHEMCCTLIEILNFLCHIWHKSMFSSTFYFLGCFLPTNRHILLFDYLYIIKIAFRTSTFLLFLVFRWTLRPRSLILFYPSNYKEKLF